MVVDPYFSNIEKNKSKPRISWSWLRWLRWLFVYPLLGLAGCHMLMTGSPVPLWYTERLDHPVLVKVATNKTLVLADGRSVPLPFIKRLPVNDTVFLKALEHGVEVGPDGEVVGLITIYPFCGNDAYLWRTKRVNLSDLAGFMDPDGIDDSIVLPEVIKFLKEDETRSLDRHGLPFMVMRGAYKVRQIYEAAKSEVEEELCLIRSFSLEQIDQ
jgi:hypothetical protein